MTNTIYLNQIENVERTESIDHRASSYCYLIKQVLKDKWLTSKQKDYLITYIAEKITLLY